MKKNLKKKILIIGDSWGCGEWDFRLKPYGVKHPGLQKYLQEEGNIVKNISRGASDKDYVIRKLNQYEKYNLMNKFDYVIVFVTDIFRVGLEPSKDFWVIGNTKENILKERDRLMKVYFEKLNSYSKPIHLIGGFQKIYDYDVNGFDNLNLLVPSFVELIVPNEKHWEICFSDYVQTIPETLPTDYIDWIYEIFKRWENIVSNNLFFATDNVHPNRAAHFLLKEYIRKNKDLDIFKI